MSQSLQLTTGTTGKRRELDFYPTPPEVTEALLRSGVLPIAPGATVWECASGSGAMSRVLEAWGYNVLSTDIQPECYGQGGIDFTEVDVSNTRVDAVITNPPFYAAEDFVSKGLKAADVVALLFKSQFWHAKKRLDLFQKTRPAFVMPLTWRPDFLQREKSAPTMEVLWTVWVKGSRGCKYIPLAKPLNVTR